MANIDPGDNIFNLDEILISIKDLVRTGFQDKYNELAKSVIVRIESGIEEVGTSGSTQVLKFYTADERVIEIPIFGGGGGIIDGLCADDICYDDAQGRYDTVQEALDSLLNPYAPPTGYTTGAPGLKEVGDSSFYPVTVITYGTRKSVDLDYVKLIESSNLGGHVYTNSTIPSGSNGNVSHSYDLNSNPALNPSAPIRYTWYGKVKDKETGERNAGSDWLQYVYPYYKFNNTDQIIDRTQIESTIIPYETRYLDTHNNGPSSITLDAAGSSQYMHILVPAAFDSVSEIIDANLGLGSAPGWDTESNPDPNTEFRRYDVTLTKTGGTNDPKWTDIPYRIYVSKIQKSNLTLIFKL